MKTTNKLGLLGLVGIGTFIGAPLIANAEANRLPAIENGKITLTEDVTISEKANQLINAKGSTLTIDLNGFKLTRDGYYGYLIDNQGILNIVDSSTGKTGNIECMTEPNDPANPSTCIRNYDELNVEGVKVKANWTAFKNEEASRMSIKNTTIETVSATAGSILNYGDLTVENSTINGSNEAEGAAIFSLTYVEGDKVYSSTATVKDSTLSAYWPIIVQQGDTTKPFAEGEKVTVTVENGTLNAAKGLVRITGNENGLDSLSLGVSGEVTGPCETLQYAKEGTVLTLNAGIDDDIVVKKGVKLIVPAEMAEKDGIVITLEEGAILVNNSNQDLPVKVITEEGEKEITINNGDTYENKKEDTPEVPDDNPKTFDGITGYAALALTGISTLAVMIKKKFN